MLKRYNTDKLVTDVRGGKTCVKLPKSRTLEVPWYHRDNYFPLKGPWTMASACRLISSSSAILSCLSSNIWSLQQWYHGSALNLFGDLEHWTCPPPKKKHSKVWSFFQTRGVTLNQTQINKKTFFQGLHTTIPGHPNMLYTWSEVLTNRDLKGRKVHTFYCIFLEPFPNQLNLNVLEMSRMVIDLVMCPHQMSQRS